MTRLDTDWAVDELRRFATETQTYYREGFPRIKGLEDDVVAHAQVVEQVLDRVTSGWRQSVPVTRRRPWEQHRQAALRAITQLERSAEIAEKLGDAAPKTGQPRLRLPDDDDGATSRSVHRGIMAFAEGCYAALRNPASHDDLDDLPEDEALEQLAAFSVLARFVDRSVVLA